VFQFSLVSDWLVFFYFGTNRVRRFSMVKRGAPWSGRLRSAGRLAMGAYKAYNQVKRFRGASSDSSRQSKLSTSGFLTNQFDAKRQYRRKRMPRRRRRRWVKFVRKVNHVVDKGLASQFFVFRSNNSATPSTGSQTYGSMVMYGFDPTSTAFGNDDVYKISQVFNFPPSAENILWFKSAVLDCEWNADISNTVSLTLDVYEVLCRRSIPQAVTSTVGNTLEDIYYYGVNDLGVVGSGAPLTAAAAGVTPFQSPTFCQNFLIVNKTRVLLSPGQTCHRQMRDARDRKLLINRVSYDTAFMKGWTKAFFWIAQGVSSSTQYAPTCTINFSCCRSYGCCVRENNTNTGTLV